MPDGLLNFRAVPSFAGRDGTLREGILLRSGGFDDITAEGVTKLRNRGATRVFDLRAEGERRTAPSPLVKETGFVVDWEPHRIRSGDLRNILAHPATTPAQTADEMRTIYTDFPHAFTKVFARCFRHLIAGGAPMIIHCTAGKDRTGVSVAFLLDFLGVSRDDIFEDYLRTNEARDDLYDRLATRDHGLDFERPRPELIGPVIAADASYLAAAFATLDSDFTDTQRYMRDGLGLTAQEINALRRLLTA